MNTFTAILEPDPDGTLHVPVPPAWRNLPIRVKAELEPADLAPQPGVSPGPGALKGFGCLRGRISMAPNFDAPLEDFKDYTA